MAPTAASAARALGLRRTLPVLLVLAACAHSVAAFLRAPAGLARPGRRGGAAAARRCTAEGSSEGNATASLDWDAAWKGYQAQGEAWRGAGEPRAELPVEEVAPLLMKALSLNDFPKKDAGLRSMWAFAGQETRFVFKRNVTDFIESAHETARDFPTSFYGCAFTGKSWEMETEINRVGGEEGWIATQVMKTVSSDGRLRRWQWVFMKKTRPPNMGAWYVDSIGSSDRKGNFEAE